ncbi:NAD(P)-dependent dehydrogenase, short-chain alcohol dehydrogenase family [Collimonas sp. OK242]|jgi:NAD(P)-dependent dehydrogenase (short-subunit alcohol dehydrogenase family)|uniref:SDR family NAD(P)-dependent oxidoreductase n=1 Tax=Collimonas sp. OK242 TaxID=1798195 RepID=UPI00089AC095|nr:SDR family oxidoreductase [Collimonas sp. OK242]SDX39157.1 NAD(P)-dependent dehydrogenase, short-chain alcohol dehydrogenase family [Collimonas sp. OK242]
MPAVNDMAEAQLARFPSLKDKNVFITGGGSGIGAAIVSAFAEQGARVAFVDIETEASAALCESLAAAGLVKPLFRHCDIRDIAALQATIQGLAQELGTFDVLVNNAANDQRHQLAEVTVDYWDDRIAINQRPMFFTCQAIAPGMQKKGGGSIINLSSISWHLSNGGYPVYTTAKAAVVGLTRGLARDLGPHNIRVNTVSPGWVMTERQIALWLDAAGEEDIKRNQCLPGKLQPWHLARMVLFLAADDSAMCTAQEFIVDAGWA